MRRGCSARRSTRPRLQGLGGPDRAEPVLLHRLCGGLLLGPLGWTQPPIPPDPGAVEHRPFQACAHVPPSPSVQGHHRDRARPAHSQPARHQLLHRHLTRDIAVAAVLGNGPEHGVRTARVDHLGPRPLDHRLEEIGHPAPLAHGPVLGGDEEGRRQPLSLYGLEHPLVVASSHDHVDRLVPRPQLLGQEVQGGRAVAPGHQQAAVLLPGVRERPAERPDHVERVVRAGLGQPSRARPHHVEHDLKGAGPTSSPRGLVDREGPSEHELPGLRYADLDELAGFGLLSDVGSHQRQRVVRPRPAVRQHFALRSDHAVPSGAVAASTRAWPGEAIVGGSAAWYSCSDRGAAGPARSASIPCTAARTPGTVVMQGMPLRAAAVRMKYPSVRGSLPNGVLMTRSTRPASISSTALGLPSDRLRTVVTGTPALDRSPAVPSVARRVTPRSARRRAGRTTERLSRLATEMNTVPPAGRTDPVASWAFARASPRSAAMPMTSPVERISGPSTVSTPGNRPNGNTAAFTATCRRWR